jgi:hypothetical protein
VGSLAKVCLGVALSPFLLLILVWPLFALLGCSANLGPASTRCAHAGPEIASALQGLLWVGGMGWLFSFPLAIALGLIGRLIRVGTAESDHRLSASANSDLESTVAALNAFRRSEPVESRCTSCGSLLAVVELSSPPGARAFQLSCECGKSNGRYEVDDVAA